MFKLDEDIMRQLRATFKIEAAEHIQAMNRILLALEENPEDKERQSLLQEIFREAHSLKGAAGAADLGEVEATAHKLENVFGAAKSGKITLTRELCDVLYAGIDSVGVVVDAGLEDRPHNLDLATLFARLDAAEQGTVLPGFQPAATPPADVAPAQSAEPVAPAPAEPPSVPPTPMASTPAPAASAPVVAQLPAVPAPSDPPLVIESATPNGPIAPAPVASAPTTTVTAPVAPVAPAPVVAAPVTPAPVASTPPTQPAPSVPPATPPPAAPSTAGDKDKPSKGKPRTAVPATEETIRVATTKIDSLMAQAGELLVAGLKIDQRLNELAGFGRTVEDWNREWLKIRAINSSLLHDNVREDIRPLVKLLDQTQERLRVLSSQVGELQRGFSRDALHLSRITNDMSESVMKVRMLPVSTVFDLFPRMVRDLTRESGKQAELIMEGAETELDRKVLEAIKDPLVHLIRNSVDHGIEKPDERVKIGKPAQGTITLKAYQKGNNIVIEMTDDGGGINRDKLRRQAIKNGLISPEEATAMNDDEALRLIFAPGLSTSPIITDISGRGVGMDVVRKNVEALQGQVEVESTLGVGTTIALTLPLTLATTQELLVQIGTETYGIPISAVERIARIQAKDISSVEGRQAILVDGDPVLLVRLATVLERHHIEQQVGSDEKMPAVILISAKRRIAFLVDNVVGQQETVVKSLGKQLARVRNVAGATILGSGQVIMALNPSDLMKSARGVENKVAARSEKHAAAKATKRHTIMVVDDSLSTRTLEKSILETAGYKVVLATDGREAYNLLNTNGGCDLIVSDVTMPHMSGFELTAAVKQDNKLKKIPIILVTSLDSREDKERGIEVGADAYIVKSNFDQANLLQTITQLI